MAPDSSHSHEWADLPKALAKILPKLDGIFAEDAQFKAFTRTDAITRPATFGIKSSESDHTILVTIVNGKAISSIGTPEAALFTLSAVPQQWSEFFKPTPVAPYQSYWGMFGMNIKQEGIQVLGDHTAFAHWTHIWRRTLEILHDAYAGPTPEDEDEPETDDDHLIGRYVYLTAPLWGRCKVFYESSGTGKTPIVFLHTAGSDSRQYHGVMNDPRMLERCTMYAFDLPGHGRSFPSKNYCAGEHTNTEDSYVGCIAAFVKALSLNKPIVCGASMAGQVCLAVATRHPEVGAGGVIPLQGCDFLDMERTWHDRSPYVNQALFNPEWIYGMMSPTAPLRNRQLVWHTYSAQAYGIFHGDLDFYFGGWDGRSRMPHIDTAACPVYMLTGEYDWSGTPELASATAAKIPGAEHKTMTRLGHFPATENPKHFVGYLLEAIEFVVRSRKV